MNIDRRILRLELALNQPFADVQAMIDSGRHYSSLNEAERERYALYWGINRAALEDVEAAASGLDFLLKRRVPTPSREEIQSTINEIEEIVLNRKDIDHVRI